LSQLEEFTVWTDEVPSLAVVPAAVRRSGER
jgi:hypothetical protein